MMIRLSVTWPALWIAAAATAFASAEVPVDRSGYRPESGVALRTKPDEISIAWPIRTGEFGRLTIGLVPGSPLVRVLGISVAKDGPIQAVAKNVDPVVYLTEGSRSAPKDRPPEMSIFNVFFDTPAKRPSTQNRSRFDLRSVRVWSEGQRTLMAIPEITIGSFKGDFIFTVYNGSALVQLEAVVVTQEQNKAILPEVGLVGADPGWKTMLWIDTNGQDQTSKVDCQTHDHSLAVRHRALVAEGIEGSLAVFPPPHQYLFPRDRTDNPHLVWFGTKHHGTDWPMGMGIGQDPTGGGSFVPWFNAPPGTKQRFGVFFLMSKKTPRATLDEVLAYTHGDRFKPLPGFKTFTSHWHMAITVAAMEQKKKGSPSASAPDFLNMLRDMNVNMIHLGEFHGDGHQKDPGPLRLAELEAEFELCRSLSDDRILFIPGEEVDEFLGLPGPGKQSGHWMILFPKPVRWTMRRAKDQPFVETAADGTPIYHVGNRADMVELVHREHALVWSSHPRIKASSWTPDIFRKEAFYKDSTWLGGAWKAMPADLSEPRLGRRVLDLFDDMANWGDSKYVIGEIDVFKIDHTHELYGHMNANYMRIDHVPKFDSGWSEVNDLLRHGKFFVTTGEVLIPDCRIGGKEGGEELASNGDLAHVPVRVSLEWTFPLRFVELISGDGSRVDRQRIELADTSAFGSRTLDFETDLRGKRWARVEVWDVAADGGFTQPVWIGPKRKAGE